MDDTIIKLQETVAYQNVEIAQLSEELYTQQKELAALRLQLDRLSSLMQNSQAQPGTHDGTPEPPPPHY